MNSQSNAGEWLLKSCLALLTACGPVVDPPPLELAQCSPEDSPSELARFPYSEDNDYEWYDLVEGVTIAVDDGTTDTKTHYLVDNCGGAPLRLPRTFRYRPGAAYVGGEVVLCSGGLGDIEGVWELLEDGTAGRDLGLGRACPDHVSSPTGTALFAYGIVIGEGSEARQFLPDGTTRSFTAGDFYGAGGALLVHTREGEVTVLPPDGADPVALDLPEPIATVLTSKSPWAFLAPPHEVNRLSAYYAVNAETGEWFPTPLTTVDPREPGRATFATGSPPRSEATRPLRFTSSGRAANPS